MQVGYHRFMKRPFGSNHHLHMGCHLGIYDLKVTKTIWTTMIRSRDCVGLLEGRRETT